MFEAALGAPRLPVKSESRYFSQYEKRLCHYQPREYPPVVSVGGTQAVRRAMEVVRTVGQIQRSGASLSRVARATGLSTPTAYRLLRAMTEEAMLTFNEFDRCYYIGPLASELGLAAPPEHRVDVTWQNVVAEVAKRTRLTSYLIGRSNDEAVCLFCVQGSTAIRAMPMEVGQRVPLGLGAGSLAILASLEDSEVERIITQYSHRYAVFPAGDQYGDRIYELVRETRKRGFSISTGTVAPGTTGLGVLASPDGPMAQVAVTVSAVASALDMSEAKHLAAIITHATCLRTV